MLTNLLQSTLSEARQSCGLSDSTQDVCYTESDNSQVRHRPMPPHHGIQATIPMTVPHLLVINEDVAHPVASLPAKTWMEKHPVKSFANILRRRQGHKQQSRMGDVSA